MLLHPVNTWGIVVLRTVIATVVTAGTVLSPTAESRTGTGSPGATTLIVTIGTGTIGVTTMTAMIVIAIPTAMQTETVIPTAVMALVNGAVGHLRLQLGVDLAQQAGQPDAA